MPEDGGHSEPTWLYGLQRQAADVVVRLSGAERSWWNRGEIGHTDVDADGQAWTSGRLCLSREVVGSLIDLRDNGGRPRSVSTLIRWAGALSVVVHENTHLMGPQHGAFSEGRLDFDQPSSKFLEEGVTVLWTRAILPGYVRAVGVDRLAPGIEAALTQLDTVYATYVAGTDALLNAIAKQTGCEKADLLHQLAIETPAMKFPILAQRIFDSAGLHQRLPQMRHGHARREIESMMRYVMDPVGEGLHFEKSGLANNAAKLGRRLGLDAARWGIRRAYELPGVYERRPGWNRARSRGTYRFRSGRPAREREEMSR